MAQPQRDVVDRVQRGMMIAIASIAAVLLIGLAYRYLSVGFTEVEVRTADQAGQAGDAGAPQRTVDALLAQARTAMAESRLVAPAGDNAYENYLAVLEQQSGNVSAREALNDLYGIAVSSADQAVGAGDIDEAERLAGMLARTNPDSFTVVNLRQRIERARAAVAAAELADQQRQAQAAAAAAAGAVPPPAAPEPAGPLTEVASDLASAISPTAGAATPAPEPAAPPPQQPSAPPPAATTTTTAAAPSPRPATPAVREARLLSRVDPVYPREAARSRQNGWVEVEFTIGRDGTVSDVRVVDARPARVFNQAAQRAIQEWRFEPRLENGEPVASRMRQRFDFRLD